MPAANGDDTWELPVPATYVTDRDGRIVSAYVNKDYTQRMEPAAIMAALGPAKRLLGPAAVLWPGFRLWLSYGYPRIELLADGEPLAGSLVAVSNISRYGGPWPIQPDALPDDRRLDLLVFTDKDDLSGCSCSSHSCSR